MMEKKYSCKQKVGTSESASCIKPAEPDDLSLILKSHMMKRKT